MDRGACWAIWGRKGLDTTEQLTLLLTVTLSILDGWMSEWINAVVPNQPFWLQGLVLWKTIFPWGRVGGGFSFAGCSFPAVQAGVGVVSGRRHTHQIPMLPPPKV